MIEQNYNLNTIPSASPVPIVHVSQYDKGLRTLKFKLFEGSGEYSMASVNGAKINGKKPDGNAFSYDMTITGNVVSVDVTEQMTAVAGRVIAEIVLSDANDGILGTANFIIEVEESPIDGGIVSNTDVPVIVDFVTGGTAGQIFKRTATGGEWVDYIPSGTSWGNISGNIADQTDLNNKFSEINNNLSQKANAADVTSALALKANTSDVNTALANAIESEKTARQNGDSALHSEIESVRSAVGSPLVASTAAEMTNTNKVYVYTGSETGYTAGNWYYYDGSAWVSGGVYNSTGINTDKTLSVEDMAADAAAVGVLKADLTKSVGDLKSALTDADYYFYCTIHDGFIDAQGKIANPSSNAEKYTSLIEVPADGKIGVSLNHSNDYTMWFAYALYDSNQEFITRVLLKSDTAKSDNEIITISNDNAKFISFTFRGYNDYYFSAYNPISDRLNENILGTNSIKNGIGEYTNTFSVQSGVSHSWAVDPILVDIKSGETFIVLVKSTAVTGAQIYVQYSDATSERIYSGNVLNQIFEAKKDIVKLGLYIASAFIVSDGICKIDVIKYGIALTLNSINANYSSSIKSVNHRGFINAPENTLPAYKLSREMGFTYVETDILWTSDNIPVLLHDTTINRTARNSDGSEISGTVNISDITYEQALAYDFGIYKGQRYAGTKIPTFEEFVVLCKRLGLRPYVELKGGSQEQINGLVAIAKRYGMHENITWISFYTTFIERVKAKLPNARLGYICNTITTTKINEAVALKTPENKVFIDANYINLTTEIVESCVDADMPLEVYTVDDVNAFTTIDAYVSGYTSNKFIVSKLLLEAYS